MENRAIKYFNTIGLRSKMLLSFILLLIIPFTGISFYMIKESRNILIEKSFKESQENLWRTHGRTVEALGKALKISDKISVMSELGKILNTKYKSHLDVFRVYHKFNVFREFVDDNNEITGIRIYMDNNTLLNNWEFIPLEKEVKDSLWYKEAINAKGKNVWLSFNDITKSANSKLSLVRLINFREYGTFGVLVIDIDTNRLNTIFPEESYETFITDHAGFIVSSSNKERVGAYYNHSNPRVSLENYKLSVANISLENSVYGLKIYSLFSISSITREADLVWSFGIKSILMVFFIAIVAMFSIYNLFVQRLIKVQTSMDIVAKGQFHSLIEIDGGDEIGKLALHFNNMVENINRLITEIEETSSQKRDLEKHQNQIKLQMLASQINPHFLFNSLEAIRMKAHIDKQPEIANIVKQLGRLMRNILEIDGSWTTLRDELLIIKSFLEIEKFRLDNNLSYNLDIEDGCLSLPIPPLIIQPLIENALIHGIEKKSGGGTLSLKVYLLDDYMNVSIEDDGPGMDPENLSKIFSSNKDGKGVHIGLKNVDERLRLSYGEQSRLKISLPSSGGFHIEFKIPSGGNND
ncbi:MAG: sensor histidine kinase [Spirochaetales bacterium]|nr:sensor histidine kinase [Spirochaetales bacterium]